MVKVYLENRSKTVCTLIAVFDNEMSYLACLGGLNKIAEDFEMIITESITTENLTDLID